MTAYAIQEYNHKIPTLKIPPLEALRLTMLLASELDPLHEVDFDWGDYDDPRESFLITWDDLCWLEKQAEALDNERDQLVLLGYIQGVLLVLIDGFTWDAIVEINSGEFDEDELFDSIEPEWETP